MVKKYPIRVNVNGDDYDALVDPRKTLLQFLREDLDLTGTKEGCDEGDCGACSVIFNNKVVSSCLVLAVEADNAVIETIEGVQKGEELHPVQQAFVDSGAIQCGFCTPGMVITTKAMLEEMPDPSTEEVKEYLSGNMCRCTGYVKILDAVENAKEILKNGK
ncbi:MAG: (2Fe-2S)-binding protein [Deltaproteobacteria bacterium]|nr:(2Fe-2S)-binding protein [Deltaproteobacteria bacterium]MBW2249593.1 (2Fe-2S)-binding protein [Deltaproteobacteria bacterium]